METKVITMDEGSLDKDHIKKAGEVIRLGGLVVFPTETVYGLGANALDINAVSKIFKAKGRPQDNPLIVHVAHKNISRYAIDIPEVARVLIDKFWPGPLTIILIKASCIPDVTSAGLKSVGIRMPDNAIALSLIEAAGVPIAAPSANISGKPSPTNVARCIEDLSGKVDYIIGGDKSKIGLESTIIDCTVYPPCVLRPGGITLEQLKEIDEKIYIDPFVMKKSEQNIAPKAPGMKYRHYAPKAPVKIIEGDLQKTIVKINEMVQNYKEEHKTIGIMVTSETFDLYENEFIVSLGSRSDLNSIAQNLFEALRFLDDKQVDLILCEGFEEKGVGIAIMNRLRKSAGYDIIKV